MTPLLSVLTGFIGSVALLVLLSARWQWPAFLALLLASYFAGVSASAFSLTTLPDPFGCGGAFGFILRNSGRAQLLTERSGLIHLDEKQYDGAFCCQSCRKESVHTQINASFVVLNVLKLEDLREKNTDNQTVVSIASWKRRKFNQRLKCRVFDKLGLPLSNEKVMDTYQQLSGYGAIVA